MINRKPDYFTVHKTSRYTLERDRFGNYLLTRHEGVDPARIHQAYFQGDDARLWEHNMDAIQGVKDWRAGNTLDKSFDFLCSGYDDILTPYL